MIQINDCGALWFLFPNLRQNSESLTKSVLLYAVAGIIIARHARYTTRYFIFITG